MLGGAALIRLLEIVKFLSELFPSQLVINDSNIWILIRVYSLSKHGEEMIWNYPTFTLTFLIEYCVAKHLLVCIVYCYIPFYGLYSYVTTVFSLALENKRRVELKTDTCTKSILLPNSLYGVRSGTYIRPWSDETCVDAT